MVVKKAFVFKTKKGLRAKSHSVKPKTKTFVSKRRGFVRWKMRNFRLRSRFALRSMPRYLWSSAWNRIRSKLMDRVARNFTVKRSGFKRIYGYSLKRFLSIAFNQPYYTYILGENRGMEQWLNILRRRVFHKKLDIRVRRDLYLRRQQRAWAKVAKKIMSDLRRVSSNLVYKSFTNKSKFKQILRLIVYWTKTDKFRSTIRKSGRVLLRSFNGNIKADIRGFVPHSFRKSRLKISDLIFMYFIPLVFKYYKKMLVRKQFLQKKPLQLVKSSDSIARFKVFYYKRRWLNKLVSFSVRNGKLRLVRAFYKFTALCLKYSSLVRNILVSNRLFKLLFRLKLGFKMKKLWSRGVLQEYASIFKGVKSSSKPYIWAMKLLNEYIFNQANKGIGNEKFSELLLEGTSSIMTGKRLRSLPVSKWVYNYGGEQFFWADTFKRFIRFSKKKRRRGFKTFR